eukprot:g1328.t1
MPIERWSVISRDGEAGWCGRRKHQVVSHRGSLFLLGGFTSGGVIGAGRGPNANLHDVWKSTEGTAWVRLLERAPWSGRDGHAALAHNGAIYLMGGTQDPRNNFSDVWRSVNGREWVQVCRQAPWQGRWQHAALSYQGHMFVVGGWSAGPGCLSDAWRSSDGVRWVKTCSNAPWRGRMFHSMVEANGAMYLLGGSDGREKLNDAWVSTDGREWNLVTHDCQWSPRSGHASICFENSLYVIGGEGDNNDKLKDVWRSEDGAHWTRIEEDVRVARQGHAAVVHHGKVLVLGGVAEGTVFMNDCLLGLSAAQIAAGALREHGSRTSAREAAAASASPSSTGAPAASSPPSASTTAAAAAATASDSGAGTVDPGTLIVGGAPLQRSDEEAGSGDGVGVATVADGGAAAAAATGGDGGGGGGGVLGGGVFSRRQSSNGGAGRLQSVEDDLWVSPPPPPGGGGGGDNAAVELEEEEEDGVRAMLELSREADVLEGRVKRERFRAHRAADEEIHRTPGLYKEACALGNALILKGHDFLSQVLADAGRDSAEASIMAEEAGAWASTVADLADGEGLALKGQALKARIEELKNSVMDQEDAIVDSQGALVKGRRRGASSQEFEALQVGLATAEKGARRARRAARKAAAAAATLAHGRSPEIALDLPEALNPLAGRQQVVQDVSIAGIDLPLRRLKEYDNLRAMEDEGSTGGGQGRHRIFLAEYDDETVVLKGYALVNALQRHSLERELHILDRVRHGAIIRAGAIVEDDGGSDNPIPMLYIEFPYCAQGNLRQWLQARPRQPWELQEAFRQVMCAVMHLHDVGVIHKDIKPGNVLVHADGRFLLADFDVSKDTLGASAAGAAWGGLRNSDGGGDGGSGSVAVAAGLGDGSSSLGAGGGVLRGAMEAETTRTSLVGTSGFMAPEVESGTPSSRASDMYSLGAVLFHMHFPDHPTGPLPITAAAAGGGGSGGGGDGGAGLGSIPRSADAATAGLLRALLAVDPAKRPRASDALQAEYFRVSHVSRLQEDGALLEQTRKLEAVRALFRTVRDEAKSGGPLKWTVRRDGRYLVPSVLELIRTGLAGSALRRPLKITFEGEAGVDEGGILSEMYTLLFEAMMLPRFGLFEDCDSPPPPTFAPSSSSSPSSAPAAAAEDGDRHRRGKKDPAEFAFAPRFSGALPSAAAAAAAGSAASNGGGHPLDDDGGRFRAYLEPIPGAGGAEEEKGGEHGDDEDDEDDGDGDDSGDDFEARREAELLVVEGAAAAGSGESGSGGREGKGLSMMLPTARPGGYSDAQLGRYRAIGRAMVKCLLEGRRIGSRLAPSVFKFITGTDTTLRDLQDFDPHTFESLKWMLANTGMRDMGFDFEDVGLPDKGPVTDGNKSEYVSAKASLILVGSRRPALEALKDGFARALRDLSPGAALFMELLSHADWRVLLCGEEHVSGPQVVAVLAWHGFSSRSEVPTWIRSLLVSLPEDALRRFLIFVCGTPSLPAPAAGKVEITVRCQPRSAALPAAHTCFFQLDVPDYDKESVLRHKLLQAVNNTSSFDVV